MPTFFFHCEEVKNYRRYDDIVFGSQKLHQHGGLFKLLYKQESRRPTTFLIEEDENGLPTSIVSASKNPNDAIGVTEDIFGDIPLIFPNYEIMAFTHENFRNQGRAKRNIENLLDHMKIDKEEYLYVYSRRMKKISLSIGYTNTYNLHSFSP